MTFSDFSVRREFGWEFNVVVTLINMKADILLEMALVWHVSEKNCYKIWQGFQSVTAQIKGILYHE